MITSRWTGDLKNYIQAGTYIKVSAQDQEIALYLHYEINSRGRLRTFIEKEPTFEKEIVSKIFENCEGMFLVARLHIDSLSAKSNLRAARIALKSLPANLDGVYEKNTISRIQKQVEEDVILAWGILTWIVGTVSRLTVGQIQHALAVEPNSEDLDEEEIIDIDLMLSVYSGLVILDSQSSTVRLVHYTAQGFFERHRQEMMPGADRDITQVCLKY